MLAKLWGYTNKYTSIVTTRIFIPICHFYHAYLIKQTQYYLRAAIVADSNT